MDKLIYVKFKLQFDFALEVWFSIVISLKNIEKMFFITKCSYVDFKMGSKVIKCNNRSIFTNCFSFISLVQQQDDF